ncbi:hypothetical protein [Nocardioides mesophilus]|uniref:Uncharacterized protein n=1 Tax=Nocardioides mesophilus TaxID=433659 RepID=A0A7G9R815_9ACTN|nr:hypothetical protein [Nocardioides mesophilus]QNN51740.1 hypothetical protein H9L09_14400 [Nocardioides mesophilus]
MVGRWFVVLILCGLAVSACGEGTPTGRTDASSASATAADPAASSAPAEPADSNDDLASLPACGKVWVAGQTMPGRYLGCVVDGKSVKAQSRLCSFGKRLYTYDDSFWAVPKGRIGQASGALLEDPAYRQVLNSCTG